MDSMDKEFFKIRETPFENVEEFEYSLASNISNLELDGNWRKGKNHIARLLYLLQTGHLYDVKFLVGDEKTMVKAHSFFLISGSPIFQAMLAGRQTAQGTVLEIKDVQLKEFNIIMKFLYTGDTNIETNEFHKLFLASHFFQIDELTLICAQKLQNSISDETACLYFGIAIECKDETLKNACMDYICSKGSNVLKSEGFKNLTSVNLCEILLKDELIVWDEMEVFDAVIAWGKEECQRLNLNVNSESLKKLLNDTSVILCIRFPQMNASQFGIRVTGQQILSLEETVSIMLYFNIPEDQRAMMPSGRFTSRPRTYMGKEPVIPPIIVKRFEIKSKEKWYCNGKWDRVGFSVDADILLYGVGLSLKDFENAAPGTQNYIVEVRIEDFELQTTFGTKSERMMNSNTVSYVNFPTPVSISKGINYTVSAKITGRPVYPGHSRNPTVKVDIESNSGTEPITFSFLNAIRSENGSSDSKGQIPELLFKLQ